MLRVIDERSKRTEEGVVICLESTSREDLVTYPGYNAAVKAAAEKFNLNQAAHRSNDGGPYIPRPDGEPAETAEDFNKIAQHKFLRGGKDVWRRDYNLCPPL